MRKRILPILLALALCVGMSVLPAGAQAAGPACGPAGAALSGADLQVYSQLKEAVSQVASGARDSSVFEVSTAGMGVSYANGALHGIDVEAVVGALSVDCPYELYWFDKTNGYTTSGRSGRDSVVASITFQFSVSQDYAVTSAAGNTYYPYRPDTRKTSAAAAVAKNALAVVEQNSGLSDYGKLTAYRDYICSQVSYNSAVANSVNYPYGGPWQLIYVFDNDPGTNVVCEGYAKAFKYLCDLTSFSNRVECCIVSGRPPGDHMWNIVRINGQSYLADVTNSDTGSTGEYGGLFLAGAPNATGNGCAIDLPRHDLDGGYYIPPQRVVYTYDEDTKMLYDSSVLTLAATGYGGDSAPSQPAAPGQPTAPEQPASPAFTDVPAGQWYAEAVSWAVGGGITNGTGSGMFSPAQQCSQEQILTFLYRAARGDGVPAAPEDMAAAVIWAWERGMIDASFDGKAPCTRATAVSYIWQALGMPPAGVSSFSDVAAGDFYAGAVDWAVEAGVTEGTGNGQFSPGQVCDRGTIVTFLHRAYVEGARLK